MSLSGVSSCCFCYYYSFFFLCFKPLLWGCLWFFMVDDHKSVLYVREMMMTMIVCVLLIWFETHKHIEYMSMLFACCKFPWFMRHLFHFNCQWVVTSRVNFSSILTSYTCMYIYFIGFVLFIFLCLLLIIYRPRKLGWTCIVTWYKFCTGLHLLFRLWAVWPKVLFLFPFYFCCCCCFDLKFSGMSLHNNKIICVLVWAGVVKRTNERNKMDKVMERSSGGRITDDNTPYHTTQCSLIEIFVCNEMLATNGMLAHNNNGQKRVEKKINKKQNKTLLNNKRKAQWKKGRKKKRRKREQQRS